MVKELDGFRAIAVLLVVSFHLGVLKELPVYSAIVGTGYLGVQIFFILSSLLLSRQYWLSWQNADKKQFTITFVKKRLLRIMPLFFFSTLVLYFITPHKTYSFTDLLLYLLFIKDIKLNLVMWSLFVEMRFYLIITMLMPLVVGMRNRAWAVYLLPILVILYCYGYRAWDILISTSADRWDDLYGSLSANIDCLGLGIIAAIAYERSKVKTISRKLLIGVIALSFLIVFVLINLKYYHYHSQLVQQLILPINNICWTAIITCTLLLQQSAFNRFLSNKWFLRLSAISYSVYIWHLPIRNLLEPWIYGSLKNGHERYILITHFVATFVLAIVVSELSYRFVETPFLKRKKIKINPVVVNNDPVRNYTNLQ